ncbi:MAG: XdhC family protein [Chloroflexi bacterium]|nr:XdhC family protein [Chloroflexota bacterium]
MNDVYQELERALREGFPVVLATVAATRGSTPRRAGAKMLVRPDGSFCGTIGGGCGEAEVCTEAMATLEDGRPRLVRVDLTNPIDGDDKICGGVMDVFVERVAPDGVTAPPGPSLPEGQASA